METFPKQQPRARPQAWLPHSGRDEGNQEGNRQQRNSGTLREFGSTWRRAVQHWGGLTGQVVSCPSQDI